MAAIVVKYGYEMCALAKDMFVKCFPEELSTDTFDWP